MGAIIEVKYFNSFWMKQIQGPDLTPDANNPVWPGVEFNPFGYPKFPISAKQDNDNWYIEEARIKGGFNNAMVSQGVRAFLNEENPIQDIRESSLIYSGLYNSRTGINRTNVFSVGENIEADLDPVDGSIQKIFADDTNLTIFQENKVSKALINKNTIYSGNQGAAETANIPVIGQIVPYLGIFGIGKNPESFDYYGFQKYFVDPVRGSVMRLSRDGLTEISNYGMKDFFRDALTSINNNTQERRLPWTKVSPSLKPLTEGAEWQMIDPNQNVGTMSRGNSFTAAAVADVGPLAITSLTGSGSGATINIRILTLGTSGTFIGTTVSGGSGYAAGDQLSISDPSALFFEGTILSTVNGNNTDGQLNLNSGVNPIYVANQSSCEIFIGSRIINDLGGGVTQDSGAIVEDVQQVTDPVLGSVLAIYTNQLVTQSNNGFFLYNYKSRIIGGWDNYNRYYTVSLQKTPSYISTSDNNFDTLSYDESINGWVSRYTYKPDFIKSLKGLFFSTQGNSLFEHYSSSSSYLNYYGINYGASIELLINSNPSIRKTFNTINYEGDNGWEVALLESDLTKFTNSGTATADVGLAIPSYEEGLYVGYSGYPERAGFTRKENLYTANIVNVSNFNPEEVLPGSQLSGVKGYLARVVFSVDSSTNIGGSKEIWCVGTTYSQSS